ncbi:nitrate/nitrite transporter [Aureibacillus halotolerans]|uniref:NNP family nitrate/nitrite transporter-like MFS transporter n=1 Tax=Aureibacillus halotolerans TaxID=1508390 RepID=A0A4R6UAU7_9BACI|nr:nitrate/nitrite transporter [Aureibacillus halotolerans]TDQ43022.1 NNP family nitrate/nitrite transporter-like MFS transporter [Aureibacillus halotolerans]
MVRQAWQLPLQTLNLIAAFMVWSLLSALLPFIRDDVQVADEHMSLLIATPVVLGSILRIPFGYYASLFGARVLFIVSFLMLVPPVYLLSSATTVPSLFVSGLLLGVAGAVFSIGVTSLPKYYPRDRHGLVNGIYGVGNIGTAVTTFCAPVIASSIGWERTIWLYLPLLTLFVLLNVIAGDRHEPRVRTGIKHQLVKVYRNEKLWLLSLVYFITFGAFVAFSVFLPIHLVTVFNLANVDAGMRTAGFIACATLLRPLGGWLADRFLPLRLLLGIIAGFVVMALLLALSTTLVWFTVGCLAIACLSGLGNGIVFKLVPYYFQEQAGIVNGVVSMMGGLGGVFPPLVLGGVKALTGDYAIAFMLLSQTSLAALVFILWLHKVDRTKEITKKQHRFMLSESALHDK